MEYITSKSYVLPESSREFANAVWYNLWSRKQWPYQEIVGGDTVYWYETPSKRIVWKAKLEVADRIQYGSKDEVRDWLVTRFGSIDESQDYFVHAVEQGYCLAYKAGAPERVDLPKPDSIRFPQLGWEKVNDVIASTWIPRAVVEDTVTLDEIAQGGTLLEIVQQLNASMADVSPERVRSIVSQTLRRDTALVKALKDLAGYCCQFPGCGVRIPKRDGSYYAEVAHITPVREGGRSVIGNLLVLCPNHHKEFDYGQLDIIEQSDGLISGKLNGRSFEIRLPGSDGI